jgi:tetratricopeptide (TPR) repeat protein
MALVKSIAGSWFRWIAVCALTATLLHAADQEQFKTLVQNAFDLHREGNFSAALPLLHRAYTMQPDNYFVNLLLGIDSLRTGEVKAAVPYLKRASLVRPKEDYPLSYLGEAYARQNLYADAAASYMKAVDVAPLSAESSIAFVDFALSRFADISTTLRSTSRGLAEEYRLRALSLDSQDRGRVSLLQRAADLDPDSPGIWSELARADVQSGDWPAAEDACHRALEADPNDLAAWIVDAQLAAHTGDWKHVNQRLNGIALRSSKTLSREVANWPKDLQPPAGAGTHSAATFLTCLREGKAECSIGSSKGIATRSADLFGEQRWERVIKLPLPNAGDRQSWLRRGTAFVHLDDCRRAIPALERGLAGPTPDLYGMFQLSWCYSRQAGRAAQQVQQSPENEASLHVMRGDILLRLQAKPDLAMAEYQQAVALHPRDPSLLERLAEAQFGAGKTDAARNNADAALKVDPQRLGAKRTLAKIAIQDRDYSTALPYLKELAASSPNDMPGRVELGKACAQTGALDEARQNLALALGRGYPDEKGTLHYLLGTVLKKMGRAADAEQAFSQASQLSEAFQHKSYRDQDASAQP